MSDSKPNFINSLMEEHRIIERALYALQRYCDQLQSGAQIKPSEILEVIEFLQLYLGKYHHAKEELLLFPALVELGDSRLGGPRCTYFMGHRLDWNLVSTAVEEANRNTDSISPPPLHSGIEEILSSKSMLSIPIEEHQAGSVCTERMKRELTKLISDPSHSMSHFIRVAREYILLLQFHIKKEDECLFVMAGQELSPPVLEKLNQQSIQMDYGINPERLEALKKAIILISER